MALKLRTCIAALAAQRGIALAEQNKHSNRKTESKRRSKYPVGQVDDDPSQQSYQVLNQQIIRRLRELAPESPSFRQGTDEYDKQECNVLQDEIFRVAHLLDQRPNPANLRFNNSSQGQHPDLDQYQPLSFDLDKYEGQRTIRISLHSSQAVPSPVRDDEQVQKPPIYKLENALIDLTCYRDYMAKAAEEPPGSKASKPLDLTLGSNLNFAEESAKLTHQKISPPERSEESQMDAIKLALSLLNKA